MYAEGRPQATRDRASEEEIRYVSGSDEPNDKRDTGVLYFFFFQAEDGIRDYKVTGVQTCALPISASADRGWTTVPRSRATCRPRLRPPPSHPPWRRPCPAPRDRSSPRAGWRPAT